MCTYQVVDFGFCFSLFYATSKGLGLHEQNISPAKRPGLSQAEYAFTVLYVSLTCGLSMGELPRPTDTITHHMQNPALMTVKTSILVFYLTLTSTDRIFRWANWITLFVVNAAGLILTFINIFQCSPVQAAFHYPTPSNARCINIITLYLSSAPVNIITDLAILFLPMPLLTQIRLPRKQKIILIITFSFGFFATIVDVVRVVYLQEAATDRKLALQSVHLQNGGTDDLSCMYLLTSALVVGDVISQQLAQGMPLCPSCGPLSRSTSASFVRACRASNRSWPAFCRR